jgi:hypothetical protein
MEYCQISNSLTLEILEVKNWSFQAEINGGTNEGSNYYREIERIGWNYSKSNVIELLEVQNFWTNFKVKIQKIGPKVAFDIEEI